MEERRLRKEAEVLKRKQEERLEEERIKKELDDMDLKVKQEEDLKKLKE